MALASALGVPSLEGLERSTAVIVVSEIGDKTFLIAAILAMRHPRLIIFAGALLALALMSLLSALLGHILPTLLPRRYTTIAAAGLFFVFGARMLKEGIEMEAGTGHIEEEMREVQKEVEEADGGPDIEAGVSISRPSSPLPGAGHKSRRSGSMPGSPAATGFSRVSNSVLDGVRNLSLFLFSPVLVQAFVLTFLAEWGDRSQITTIALAAAHNVWIVTLGTILGHSLCTAGAVMGGRWLATKISIKNVTLGGAVLFLIFGAVYSWEAYYWSEADEAGIGAFR